MIRHATGELLVGDSALLLAVETQDLIRNSTGRVRFTLQNPSAIATEIVTARGRGREPSDEVRIRLLDSDGNLLLSQPYKQIDGEEILQQRNGVSVARIVGGGSFTSEWIEVPLAEALPDAVTIEVVVDSFHYRIGYPEHVAIEGMVGSGAGSLAELGYSATVEGIDPSHSFGGEPVVISGMAVERDSGAAMANMPVKVVVAANGFERSATVDSDIVGNYSHTFNPLPGESGLFTVSAIHPEALTRPGQESFTIGQIRMVPGGFNLRQPYDSGQEYDQTRVTAGADSGVSGLRLELDGVEPPGITLTLPEPVELAAGRSATLPFTLLGESGTAAERGVLDLKLVSDTTGELVLGWLPISYTFSTLEPLLNFEPNYLETGVEYDGSVSETITLKNGGLVPLEDVEVELVRGDGGAAPGWIYLTTSGEQGELRVGESRGIDLTAAPSTDVAEGIHEFKLRVTGSNHPVTDINIFVTVVDSGEGGVLFKISDIYTATLDENGDPIQGVGGARIRVQHEEIYSIERSVTADEYGEALLEDLPTGRYRYRVSASDHESESGRFTIRPGVTAGLDIFLSSDLVTVEWGVKETTIEDRYEIVLRSTFKTDVPAAVVVAEPTSTTLPDMEPGEVFYGDFRLTNHGLVRADNLEFILPEEDAYYRIELVEDGLPESLGAKESITVPYRVVAISSLSADGEASGGGCSEASYNSSTDIIYTYTCANGVTDTKESSFSWTSPGRCWGEGSGKGRRGFELPGAHGFNTMWDFWLDDDGYGRGNKRSVSSSPGAPSTPLDEGSCPNDCTGGSCACGDGSDGSGG